MYSYSSSYLSLYSIVHFFVEPTWIKIFALDWYKYTGHFYLSSVITSISKHGLHIKVTLHCVINLRTLKPILHKIALTQKTPWAMPESHVFTAHCEASVWKQTMFLFSSYNERHKILNQATAGSLHRSGDANSGRVCVQGNYENNNKQCFLKVSREKEVKLMVNIFIIKVFCVFEEQE